MTPPNHWRQDLSIKRDQNGAHFKKITKDHSRTEHQRPGARQEDRDQAGKDAPGKFSYNIHERGSGVGGPSSGDFSILSFIF